MNFKYQKAIFLPSWPLHLPEDVFSGRRREMNSARRHGSEASSHTPKRIGHGNAISPTFRSTRSRMILAARSASMKNGIGQVLRSVMRDRMNPGQIAFTQMPSPFSIPRKESAQLFIAAFVAAYEGHVASGA